ncbi:SpaH/EbpB family LPXTG-anchored major pilin [Knoellia koreensis]|uniref:SpaH/EbpB family LPXTG-anchored major pilin n=1 Tax=Knoellia koreensis TaxID=2730921 RepID=A0A849HIK6_9MICO|nr:SpaH/EbpB family LPXTG-anchored major pilin [Knoellia sp. DB2414S]NNM47258.1 SpaH/EbpB family LPXTG-anchored major pilin [Knoellia sp. DB2414S]
MSKRSYAYAAAVLAAATLTLAPATVALADTGNPYAVGGVSQENTSNKALINPTATVQLSIHKYLGVQTGQPNNGTEQTVNQPPLQGVNFDVYQVFYDAAHTQKVDLTTNQGWTDASAITGYTPSSADIAAGSFTINGKTYYIAKSATVTTDASGSATFTKPTGVGFYLVAENLKTSGTLTSNGTTIDKSTVTPAAPFFVTLPMTNPSDPTRWMYDVNVYPKNQSDSIAKAATDKGTTTGDAGNTGSHAVDYTVTSSITDGTNPLGMYVVYDDLDPALTFTGADLKLSNGTALVAGTDYTVYTAPNATTPATAYTSGSVANGPLVTVVFTDAGLAKLEANRSLNVVTTLHTTVGALDADGVIPNKASFVPNQNWWDQYGTAGVNPETPATTPPGTVPGTPSPVVESKYGTVVVDKYDPQNSGANLAGAVFAIYADATPGDNTCSASDVSGTPINTATIGSNNKATFTGLQTSNFYNGGPVADQTKWLSYCLVETKAPAGYNLDAAPRYITIDYTTGSTTAPASVTQRVANEQANFGNSLPLTGGSGVAAMSALGLLLVGGGVAYSMKNRRREEQDA